ncbi:G protein-like protein-coupled receptor : PQ-loop [Hyaloscypha finlandica]|nr:G protein-like protein-coupled receptor : PQ-loop [Hyaloscypha finlandica]KAH8751583.1 G protein-like protein-coupled receptor : PQ-loop [Hyaloscypha sp. PMI_1271]
MGIPTTANVLGTIGAVCWSVQLIPQIITNYRRHNTIGLQRSMMRLWACAGVSLGAYNVSGHFNIALQVQPQILTVFGAIEAGLVFALKTALRQNLHGPLTLLGVISTILLSAGVLRHYYDIYIHRTVRGISFIFVAIDAAGDVFSLISVFLQPKLDILGMVIYATEFVLWCGVFACGGYFNLMPWIRQKVGSRRREEGTQDDVAGIDAGASNDVSLSRVPSSTSVFRTPRSVVSDGMSMRSRTVDWG